VVRVNADGTIATKGDAKPRPDPFTVARGAVGARVVMHVPAAGRVIAFLMSPMGLLWIAAGAVMLFVMPFVERRQEVEETEQEQLAAMRAELHTIAAEIGRLRAEPVQEEPVQAEPVEAEPEPAEEEATPLEVPATDEMPVVDWTDLETVDEPDLEPHWPEPPEFLPGYVPVGREAEAVPEAEPLTYVVRRRSGGLLARLR
jgi:hypothetical protein